MTIDCTARYNSPLGDITMASNDRVFHQETGDWDTIMKRSGAKREGLFDAD